MDIKWEQVKPDFSSSSASMKNTLTSLSQAGTVFDKMRQSILDEEQRAAENAYKQQVFDENVRQFEAQQAYNAEQKRLDRLHAFDLEDKRQMHDKAMTDLRQRYALAQIDKRHRNALELETGKRQRYSTALTLGTAIYNDRIKAGDTPAQALDAANTRVINEGFGDLKIDAMNFVPIANRNAVAATLTKEYQANEALNNIYIAANAAKEIRGNDSEQYANFMSRLVPVDGELAIRDTNGNVRALTPEEYSYYDSIANINRADDQSNLAKKLPIAKEVLSRTGIDEQTANTYANRILMGALGEQNLANDIAREFGLTNSKDIVSVDLQDRVNTELSRRKAIEDAEIAQQKTLSDDKKYTTFDKVRTDFINGTYKTAGDDGKSKIIALPTNAISFVNNATETIYKSGGSATQLKRVLGALKQDVIADRGLIGFNPKAAEAELKIVLAELEKEKGIGIGISEFNKDADQKEELADIRGNTNTGNIKDMSSSKAIEEMSSEEIQAQFKKDREPIIYSESDKTKAKKQIPTVESRIRRMKKILQRPNLTETERKDAEEDLARFKAQLAELRQQLKG